MSNFSEHNGTGDTGRHDDARDGIVDESAITDAAIIAELLEGDDPSPNGWIVDRCVDAVRHITHEAVEPFLGGLSDDPWGMHDEIARIHEAVALQLLGKPSTSPEVDEAALLDGEQGISCRLQPLPDGFADFAHRYVAEACAGARNADQHVAQLEDRTIPEAELRHAEHTEESLHDFLDALFDSWQVSTITRKAGHARTISTYHFHNGWKHYRRAA